MRQIAERMVARGHEVTVATTKLAARHFSELNGVHIKEFGITGNSAGRIVGEVERYRQFVLDFPADAILIKAAQQWTFDALLPILDRIHSRKVFIPCGFSGLHNPAFAQYFRELPKHLAAFDRLIFYANQYRDIDFARQHGLQNWVVIPNGADEREFGPIPQANDLRKKLGITPQHFVFSTVGSLTGRKGHLELAMAFARMRTHGRAVTLILNGNALLPPQIDRFKRHADDMAAPSTMTYIRNLARSAYIYLRRLPSELRRLASKAKRKLINSTVSSLNFWIHVAQLQPGKTVLRTDLSRDDVVRLFQTTDLFVFCSNIEYSPLVLFESAAAGTPFLTVPVGNAREILAWTGGGLLCDAKADEQGMTRVNPRDLAAAMEAAMLDPASIKALGARGRAQWKQHFSWDVIANHYENILTDDISGPPAGKLFEV